MPPRSTPPPWSLVAPDLARDGTLRDIYVLDTDVDTWRAVLTFVLTRYGPVRFTVDGAERPLPADVGDMLALWDAAAPMLQVLVGPVSLHCHFFSATEIEFDLEPADVADEDAYLALVCFLSGLADAASRPALLTPENGLGQLILEAVPGGDVRFHPPTPPSLPQDRGPAI